MWLYAEEAGRFRPKKEGQPFRLSSNFPRRQDRRSDAGEERLREIGHAFPPSFRGVRQLDGRRRNKKWLPRLSGRHDPVDQRRIVRQQSGARQAWSQLAPARLELERFREERQGLVD